MEQPRQGRTRQIRPANHASTSVARAPNCGAKGGERAFLERMVAQSAGIPKRCLWFTSLVSKAENVAHVEAALKKVHPVETRIIPMAQGQKQSRLIAWTFCGNGEMERWRKARWATPAFP